MECWLCLRVVVGIEGCRPEGVWLEVMSGIATDWRGSQVYEQSLAGLTALVVQRLRRQAYTLRQSRVVL